MVLEAQSYLNSVTNALYAATKTNLVKLLEKPAPKALGTNPPAPHPLDQTSGEPRVHPPPGRACRSTDLQVLQITSSQPFQQFGVDAAEAAVAEDADDIAAGWALPGRGDPRWRPRPAGRPAVFAGGLQVAHELLRDRAARPARSCSSRATWATTTASASAKAATSSCLKHVAPGGVGARLEHRPDLLVRET